MNKPLDPEVSLAVIQVMDKMVRKDFLEIPNSGGMLLIKRGTKAFKDREEDLSVTIYPIDDNFCVTSK